ncbi:hypothetical protein AALO_G00205590 [Alosa alosa]|uniref:Uncharacterized protein n=1 Tax=Alosa alosa TaxID=278164 RepID=A0AAV6G8F1_9TELE|nr:hypothetical protein AALO_G00205590 [Alosa alosa]
MYSISLGKLDILIISMQKLLGEKTTTTSSHYNVIRKESLSECIITSDSEALHLMPGEGVKFCNAVAKGTVTVHNPHLYL